MENLFPPIIEGKLPAQSGNTLYIPFQHNPSVSQNNKDFKIKISTLISGEEILENELLGTQINNKNIIQIINNNLSNKLRQSQFYKMQVAYIDSEYFSNVGIFKYTSNFEVEEINISDSLELSTKIKSADLTEYIYSYRYIILSGDQIFFDSNDILYNQENTIQVDDKLESTCLYPLLHSFPNGEYIINFTYQTSNNYYQPNSPYSKAITINYTLESLGDLDYFVDMDKGVVNIDFNTSNDSTYRLVRKNNNTQELLAEFTGTKFTYEDFSHKCDDYIYSIQSGSLLSGSEQEVLVFSDFEDIFLADENKQLCIRFNPKINSFKENIKETKQDTLGGKYPFFFRSGDTYYKEFSINGLISYHMDNDLLFMPNNPYSIPQGGRENPINSNNYPTVNQTGFNIVQERKFREEVIKWLNNGKPKMFRSPYEGNYIVRLMNVSLTPEEQLSRMIYSFSATAYEIDDYTQQNLIKNKCLFGGAKNDI